MTRMSLGEKGVRAFESRGISSETAVRFGIYTGERGASGSVVPAESGNIVVFPFWERGQTVSEKFRAPGKVFWQRTGGKRTFWNSDILDDPLLASGAQALIITEGELDALTAIDCGFPFTVSVPDGAPGVPKGEAPEDLKPLEADGESTGKFEFMWNNRDRLKNVKRFILAVDNDAPGKRLAAELVRRLSASRCLFVTYPPEPIVPTDEGGKRPCKDLNDVLMHFGRDAVVEVVNSARPYPVRGLYRLKDYPDLPPARTFETGWSTIDQHFKPWLGEFVVINGIPGHGKSAWAHHLLMNLAEIHGWRSVMFCPEEPTAPQLRDKLRRIKLRRDPQYASAADIEAADDWISEHFLHIDNDPSGENDDDFTLEWVMEKATDAVLRDGVQAVLIDPWNEVEHARRRDELMTDYISRSIRALKRFARQRGVLVAVLAHPTKDVGKDGKARMPSPYDTADSAHWFNKADHFLTVHRPDDQAFRSVVRISKAKHKGSGSKGTVYLQFDEDSARFDLLGDVQGAGGFA